jgi:hypothetical protein
MKGKRKNYKAGLRNIRFNRGIDESLVWMYEKRRDELNAFDSRRRLTFNEFLNDVVGDWLGKMNKSELSKELGELRAGWLSGLPEKKEVDEEDW